MLHWFALLFTVLPIWFALWNFRWLIWWGFLLCSTFVSFSIMSIRQQKPKKKKKKQIRGTELPKQKTNFLLPRFLFFFINSKTRCTYTVCNMSKYGVFFGSYFPVFGLLNTERYFVSLRIHSKCGKIRTRKISIFGHFSRSFTLTVRCQVAAKGQKHINKPLAKRCYLFHVYITFCYNQAWDC